MTCRAAQPGDESRLAVLTGQAAFTDAAKESPGTRRHLTVADLPDSDAKDNQNVIDPNRVVPAGLEKSFQRRHSCVEWHMNHPPVG